MLQRWIEVKRLLLYNGCAVISAGIDECVSSCEMPVDPNCALFQFVGQYSIKEIAKLIYNTLETIHNTVTDQNRNVTKVQSRICKLLCCYQEV